MIIGLSLCHTNFNEVIFTFLQHFQPHPDVFGCFRQHFYFLFNFRSHTKTFRTVAQHSTCLRICLFFVSVTIMGDCIVDIYNRSIGFRKGPSTNYVCILFGIIEFLLDKSKHLLKLNLFYVLSDQKYILKIL